MGLDAIVLPKVRTPVEVGWLDLLLTQLEQPPGWPGRFAIEAQIEDAADWLPWTRSQRRHRGLRRSFSVRPTSWRAWACVH